MKRFTKLFMTLALLCVAGSVSVWADDEIDLTADMFFNWNGYGADAVSTSAANVDFNIGNDVELGGGGMVCGTGTVDYLIYADLTGSTKLLIEGTVGLPLRVLMNRQESNNGPLVEKNPTIGNDGKAELDLTDLAYVHINAIKVNWGATGKVSSIKFVKPSDPLAVPKENLKKAINTGKLQNSFAKTADSFAALTSAISEGESALENATSVEKLNSAAEAITKAINGLELVEGYSNLTANMFKHYASLDEPGDGSPTGCSFVLGSASDLPFGDSNVGELNWADLSEYGKLIVVTSGDIKPRFCLNRLVKDGQQAATKEDSKMLDINPNNDFTWSTEKYLTVEGNVYTVDIAKIVADYGFARLHCIKKQGWGAGVFVTDLLLEDLTESTTVPVTITDAGYATFCSEKAVALETGMEAYAVEYTGSSAKLIPVEGSIEANTPVILEASKGDYDLNIVESGAAPEKNDLLVSDGNVVGDGTVYVLANGSKGVGFYKLAPDVKVPAGKAYLKAAAEGREFIGFGDATAIKNIETVKADGAIYNLAGQQVKSAQKGVFIVNGKKAVVK